MYISYPFLNRPELDVQILTCLIRQGSPAQLPEGICKWVYQLYEEPEGSGPHVIVKAALDDLQTASDPVY